MIRAYRTWRIVNGSLYSTASDYVWCKGTNTALCSNAVVYTAPPVSTHKLFSRMWAQHQKIVKPIEHLIPDENCSCGFYALKQPTLHCGTPSIFALVAVGEVGLSGKIIEGEDGYRAQYAEILSIKYIQTFRAKNFVSIMSGGAPPIPVSFCLPEQDIAYLLSMEAAFRLTELYGIPPIKELRVDDTSYPINQQRLTPEELLQEINAKS